MILKVILVAVTLLALAFAAIGIKMFLKKGGEFKKQCSSVDANGNRLGCACGSEKSGECHND
jgi:hypothetical protein